MKDLDQFSCEIPVMPVCRIAAAAILVIHVFVQWLVMRCRRQDVFQNFLFPILLIVQTLIAVLFEKDPLLGNITAHHSTRQEGLTKGISTPVMLFPIRRRSLGGKVRLGTVAGRRREFGRGSRRHHRHLFVFPFFAQIGADLEEMIRLHGNVPTPSFFSFQDTAEAC